MKKNGWQIAAAGILTAGILIFAAAIKSPQKTTWQLKESVKAAARVMAGEGMLRLVEDSLEKPRVALTFDDGPSKKYTPMLLDGLKERGIQASFFLTGKNIEGNEELVKRISEEGHLIGNHTYNHVQLSKLSAAKAKEEIEKTSNEIYELTGVYPLYLRPPFGSWRKDMELCVNMFPVFWTVDTLDWESKNVDSILQIVDNQVEDGSIILMHDGYETSVEAAFQIIDKLSDEGYDFVTVDRMLVL
ncbi:MAG: polysaccharide deacetylase family protein [Eubacteriales bacterium]|nr:polysaccharide deacetylase family protein [Eubacteriales bacterium]